MEQKLIQIVLGMLAALMAWNFKTVQQLEVEMRAMMVGHVQMQEFQALKSEVSRNGWILQDLASEK